MAKIEKALKDAGLIGEAQEQTPAPVAGHNSGIDWNAAKDYVARIEALNEEKASIMGKAKQECKVLSEDIADILEEAKVKGVPKKAIRAVVKARELERKADAARDDLEADQQDAFDNLRLALGDFAETDLGAAALARQQAGSETLDALTSH